MARMSDALDSNEPSGIWRQCEKTVSNANGIFLAMISSRNTRTPSCESSCQRSSLSRNSWAHFGKGRSGRMDIVSLSAFTSGILVVAASRSYHRVDLPEPLCPARTNDRGFSVAADAFVSSALSAGMGRLIRGS
jgi:hypothetical protein